MSIDAATRIFAALDIRTVLTVQWRGGELDRLLDEGHAAVAGACADLLRSLGWQVLTEVTYSIYGERGSIDLLAWHRATRTLLVVEIKTEIASAEELLRRHDAKVRLAPQIARERFGVSPAAIGRLLVVADTSANRARAARLAPLLQDPYPDRGQRLKAWLARPTGALGGLLFLGTGPTGAKRLLPRRARTSRERRTGGTGIAAGSGR